MREPDFYAVRMVGVHREIGDAMIDEKKQLGKNDSMSFDTNVLEELSTEEESSSSAPVILDAKKKGLLHAEAFIPRPLPPLFDNTPVASMQNPGAHHQ